MNEDKIKELLGQADLGDIAKKLEAMTPKDRELALEDFLLNFPLHHFANNINMLFKIFKETGNKSAFVNVMKEHLEKNKE